MKSNKVRRIAAESQRMLLVFARIAHAGRKAAALAIVRGGLMGAAPRAWSQNDQAIKDPKDDTQTLQVQYKF